MAEPMVVKRIPVSGMTCAGCETRIEAALLALPGVKKVRASAKEGQAEVTYDPGKATLEAMHTAIEQQGYGVGGAKKPEGKMAALAKTAGLGALLLAFVLLGSRMGWFQVFNFFPLADESTGYGMLFVIGLLTSVHCVAMCGGISLSQCLNKTGGQGKFSGLVPSFLYNLGRAISYTVIGGIVGAVGSVVTFTGMLRGVIQLMAGVFMVLMGLNLSGLFPSLGRFVPHLPKALGRKIAGEKKRSGSPLYVGLLNGLMPCGPLQAMQLYALSTGSMLGGALSMLLFSLGTVPLMFALGALSTLLSRRFTRNMVAVGAVLVVVMGISMFQNGLALSGIGTGGGLAQSAPEVAEQRAAATQAPEGTDAGGTPKAGTPNEPLDAQEQAQVQEITSTLTGYGYPAITVQAGVPVKWTIKAPKGSLNGCNYALVIPEYNIEKTLAVGDNIIEFTPSQAGTFPYSCWMGMIRSTIKVTAPEKGAPEETAPPAASVGSSPALNLASFAAGPETKEGPLFPPSGGCCCN